MHACCCSGWGRPLSPRSSRWRRGSGVAGLVRACPPPGGGTRSSSCARPSGVRVFADMGLDAVGASPSTTPRIASSCRPTIGSCPPACWPGPVRQRSLRASPAVPGTCEREWAIINGERETAITVHVMAPGLDAGNILHQQRVPIGPDDTVGDLYEKLNEVQRQVLGDVVARHLDGYEGAPRTSRRHLRLHRVPDDGRSTGRRRRSRSTRSSARSPRRIPAPTRTRGPAPRRVRAAPLQRGTSLRRSRPRAGCRELVTDGHVDVLTATGC